MKRFIKLIKEKWLKQTSLTIALVAIILAIFLALNAIMQNLNLKPIDFTKEKVYSLSDESKEEIKKIEQNVNIYLFGYTDESEPAILAKQYKNINDKITTQIINASERPDLATEYSVGTSDTLVVVAAGKRYKIISSSEMYTYDMAEYKTIDITEQKLTSAIIDVTIARKPQVYFLTGHGELGIDSSSYMYTLSQQIINDVNDVNTLDLLQSDMPETCDVLIIANPTQDFTELETEKIINYINNGGNIIWMQDPYLFNENQPSLDNVNKVLSLYGISFSKGVVCEQSTSNMVAGSPEIIIPEMNYNSIVEDIYTSGSIIMFDAGRINTADNEKLDELGVTANAFIKSTDKSFYREDANSSIYQKLETDENGPFVLGETLTKKINDNTKSTLVAYSNAMFVTNYTIQIGGSSRTTPISVRNNRDIILNTIAMLTNREDSIRIRKDTGIVTYTATEKQDATVRIIIFTFPIVLMVGGIAITIIRKMRNK